MRAPSLDEFGCLFPLFGLLRELAFLGQRDLVQVDSQSGLIFWGMKAFVEAAGV